MELGCLGVATATAAALQDGPGFSSQLTRQLRSTGPSSPKRSETWARIAAKTTRFEDVQNVKSLRFGVKFILKLLNHPKVL